ncbi:MAG: PQQ-dependent sugar dehydrogenase [Flavobacteriales bacterium]|jgi:glucose/arabinose dehydrogenase|nr:PQQ-dependent sugar dehydrogenase [Flavobacteriales bacterium]
MKITTTLLLSLFLGLTAISQTVSIEKFNDDSVTFDSPVDLQNAGDDRLFVVEKAGIIKILKTDGTINDVPYLNIDNRVFDPTSPFDERGLLGLAFHPDYATNGYFYVNYINNSGDTQVSRFTVDPGNPEIAFPGSELEIISYSQPFGNHNGGALAFGPDGFLYIASGDGGSGGDPGNRAQNTTLLLGKLLRIDVDNPSGGDNYGIPADNPFAGSGVDAEEIWAYGLRNPFRFSFDFVEEEVWIGDVGQNNIEEVDRAGITEAGLNYGWRCYEGSQPFNTANCPDPSELTFPVAEYTHAGGNCSIVGGYVYRGNVYDDLQGIYLFADTCSGMIGTVDQSNNQMNQGDFNGTWVSFGQDVNNELYIVDLDGDIYSIKGSVLATPEHSTSLDISMTPNPASEAITIAMTSDTINSIVITNIRGSIVYEASALSTSEKNIAVNGLSNGLYLVRITSEGGETSIKKLLIN